MKKRNQYNLTHQVSTLGYIGTLVPFMRLEVAPGDTFNGKVGMLVRMSPLKHALLQDLYIDQYIFYVPHRLVWSGWEDFIAAGPNDDTATPGPPNATTVTHRALFETSSGTEHIAPFARGAYNLVWNEFFRDQDGQNPVASDFVPPDVRKNLHLVSPKRHYWNELRSQVQTGNLAVAQNINDGNSLNSVVIPATEILKAIALQKLQMKRATYGTRYVDILKSYGVNVNYQMLQRPELVAAAHASINVTDVVSTGPAADTGKLAGYGVAGNRIRIRRKSFPEHGTLLGVMVVRPAFGDAMMADWLDRGGAYTDYYDPMLELLPPVEVQARKILFPQPLNPTAVIGYMPWGEWYRKATNRVHADLQDWVGEHFGMDPTEWGTVALTRDMLIGAGPADFSELFVDTAHGHFQVAAVNALRALRLIKRGTPALAAGST